MYGWINACLECLILNQYGPETWNKIKEIAECTLKNGDFIRNVDYPDDITFRLINACTNFLKIDRTELLESFGINFIEFVREHGYEVTIRTQGNTFQEWLRNLNEPHRLLRSRFPNAHLSEFWAEHDDQDPNRMILHYYTHHGELFVPMVTGLVKQGAKKYYHKQIKMNMLYQTQEEISLHTAWEVLIQDDIITHEDCMESPKKKMRRNPSFPETTSSESLGTMQKNAKCPYEMFTNQNGGMPKCPFDSMTNMTNMSNISSMNHGGIPKCPFDNMANMTSAHNGEMPKCPFDDMTNLTSMHNKFSFPTKQLNEVNQQPLSNNPTQSGIGLGPNRVKELFPFHIVVNNKLEIIQVGNKLTQFFLSNGFAKSLINTGIEHYFTITTPPNYPWDWFALKNLDDSCFEMTTIGFKKNVIFRGSLVVLDPSIDISVTEPSIILLISPHLYNLDELLDYDLKLSDLPKHNFQRDLLIIGEHLKGEADSAVKLDLLSRKLDEESRKSLNALKTKRIFVRYVSHEIRTPLNITLLGLKFLEDELKKHEQKQLSDVYDVLDDVKTSCSVAVDILNDLLLYEKLDDGIFTLNRSDVAVLHFFKEAINVFKVQAKSSDINFVVSNDDVDNVHVSIDRTKFSQVLRNLVSNALKFTPKKGKVTVSCTRISRIKEDSDILFSDTYNRNIVNPESSLSGTPVSSSSTDEFYNLDNGYVRISITDTGPGINKEDQRHLFHEFTQFKADKLQNGQGSGLGLWIANNLMRLHGGRIGIFSAGEGKGSTFVIDIPILKIEYVIPDVPSQELIVSQIHSEEKVTPPMTEAMWGKLASMKLLIVDDGQMNRKVVRRLLQNKVNIIEEAENGQDAVDKFYEALRQGSPFNLVMMDFLMPVMNGLDATRLIRKSNQPTLIVGVTGNGLQTDIDMFMESGVDHVMIKPLNIDELIRYLSRHL